MTDTAREAAIERVRAWVAENADKPDDYDTRDGDILLGDIRLLLTDPRQPSEAPVAWRVKDFADGWIVFDNKARAEEEAMATGALIQPLFASEPPVTADEGWRPIEGAPNKRDWLKHSGDFLVGLLHQPHNEDGEEDGEPYWLWRAVAYLSADGWMVRSTGFRGLHGNCSFPLNDNATHWRPLPPAPPTGEGEP